MYLIPWADSTVFVTGDTAASWWSSTTNTCHSSVEKAGTATRDFVIPEAAGKNVKIVPTADE